MRFLENVKIIDFSQRLPGPYCSSILADLGAEVIMVERSGSLPETRSVFPGLFELVNRNKRSISLDLKNGEGKKIATQLIKESDVLIEEFQPGVAARLGIDYERVAKVNRSIIYCSISGFGQDGPYRDRVGHDVNYLSLSGIMSIPGQFDVPPSRPGVPMVDLTSGMYAAIAVLAALVTKGREGVGTYIDVSMFDTMVTWMSVRAGNLLVYGKTPQNEHLSPLNTIFETKDGRKISVGLVEQHFWRNFVDAAGEEKLLRDERFTSAAGRKKNDRELLEILKKIILKHTAEEWEQILDWRKIPYAKVHSVDETIGDAHVQARNMFSEIEVEGLGKIREVLFPVQFSGSRPEIRTPPPRWGEHTDEILKGLGYSEGEITRLRQNKIV